MNRKYEFDIRQIGIGDNTYSYYYLVVQERHWNLPYFKTCYSARYKQLDIYSPTVLDQVKFENGIFLQRHRDCFFFPSLPIEKKDV